MPLILPSPVPTERTARERRLASLRQGSRLTAVACLLLATALPLAVLSAFIGLSPEELLRGAGAATAPGTGEFHVAVWQRVAVTLLVLWPAGCVSHALLQARRALRSFACGAYFGAEATHGLRGFGSGLFLAAMAQLVVTPVSSVILTYGLGADRAALRLGLSSTMLMQLVMAGIVWLIAAVLAEAREIADENAQFV